MTTYATLQTDIVEWSARSDVSGKAPSFIRLAEAWINRNVRVLEMETDVELEFTSAGDYYVAAPDGFLGFRMLVNPESNTPDCIYAPPNLFEVEKRQPRDGFSPVTDGATVYTISAGGVKVLAPSGATDPITLVGVYHKRLLALSDSNTSNFVLLNHYDLYLNAALREVWDWADDEAQASRYELRAQKIVGQIIEEEQGKRRGTTPFIRRPPMRGVV